MIRYREALRHLLNRTNTGDSGKVGSSPARCIFVRVDNISACDRGCFRYKNKYALRTLTADRTALQKLAVCVAGLYK